MIHWPVLDVRLVDPSLFTAPYDAALTEGLLACNVRPLWATRPTRQGDRQEIAAPYVDAFFYRRVDEALQLPRPLRALAKGCAHALGLARLVARVWRGRPDVVHVQWVVLPPLDALALLLIRARCALVLTVHDTVPFNGERLSLLQNLGFGVPIRLAHRVIVHTQAGRQTLIDRGVAPAKIHVVPHGPLQLPLAPRQAADAATAAPRDPRWTLVLFGEIKPYKGLDILIDALSMLSGAQRQGLRVIVAGRPRMDLGALTARVNALGLGDTLEWRTHRHSDQEMADLFDAADGFVFPYRQIDASGVYFLVKSLGKWLIASRVGIFAEDLQEGVDGALLPSGDSAALAAEIARAAALRRPPRPLDATDSWEQIGAATRGVYEAAISSSQAAHESAWVAARRHSR